VGAGAGAGAGVGVGVWCGGSGKEGVRGGGGGGVGVGKVGADVRGGGGGKEGVRDKAGRAAAAAACAAPGVARTRGGGAGASGGDGGASGEPPVEPVGVTPLMCAAAAPLSSAAAAARVAAAAPGAEATNLRCRLGRKHGDATGGALLGGLGVCGAGAAPEVSNRGRCWRGGGAGRACVLVAAATCASGASASLAGAARLVSKARALVLTRQARSRAIHATASSVPNTTSSALLPLVRWAGSGDDSAVSSGASASRVLCSRTAPRLVVFASCAAHATDRA